MTVWQDESQPWNQAVPAHEAPPPDTAGDSPGGFDFGVFAKLAVHLESMAARQDREDRRRSRMVPADITQAAAGVVPSTGDLVLDLGSCPMGRAWQIRRLVVGGAAANDTPTGSAFVFATGYPPADLSTVGMVDSFPSFSSGAQGNTYGTHQLWLVGGVHLWVVIAGGSAGVQWVAAFQGEDFEEEAYRATFVE